LTVNRYKELYESEIKGQLKQSDKE